MGFKIEAQPWIVSPDEQSDFGRVELVCDEVIVRHPSGSWGHIGYCEPRVSPAVNQGSTLAGSFIDGAIVRNEKTTKWSNLGITPGATWGKGDEKRPTTLNRQSRWAKRFREGWTGLVIVIVRHPSGSWGPIGYCDPRVSPAVNQGSTLAGSS